ncbi:putative HAD-hydrolase YfnB [Enterococcus saigonensis]|uniref:Putative HAD-hydrolase YfnB n=1 Tax=Enterococcus saigonensis TaxID=1805431 RepID=A0A679IM22_9ENTE|nr:YjjG family noncanonical pyrimidine nucleotidase [Enterococcus saigonensis]BCA86575.1 putative HAD-hydrolase YfnB [Enterococcus saigonensis]
MNYSTLLFDLDDTLLDFKAAEDHALQELFNTMNTTLTPEIKKYYKTMNRHLWADYEQGKISRQEVTDSRFKKLFANLGKNVDGSQLDQKYRHYLTQGHQLLGNSRRIIADLANKADLYVVTNGVSKTQYKRLEDAKLLPYFKDIFVSEDTGYQKPMPEYFDYVAKRIPHFVAQKALVIGDSLTSDIKGANNAGLDSVWLNPEAKQLLPDVKPTYEVKDLEQLYPILGTSFDEKA